MIMGDWGWKTNGIYSEGKTDTKEGKKTTESLTKSIKGLGNTKGDGRRVVRKSHPSLDGGAQEVPTKRRKKTSLGR